jgi:NADH dehydrogenase FAD-containing subunit
LKDETTQEMTDKLGKRAVIVGAGFTGLSAGGAVAKYLLERDLTPVATDVRPCLPQSRHAHGLMAGAMKALSEIFPGFEGDLEPAGGTRVRIGRTLDTKGQ